ncbi:hypothetical protein AB0M79_09730 [Polymorphospora sp. NPDC051019]|uniref:hypothetical protein n=1 Tax=Polymorphospora sp. NPDC051019 TaxID=3155725 RepID=UPI003437335F
MDRLRPGYAVVDLPPEIAGRYWMMAHRSFVEKTPTSTALCGSDITNAVFLRDKLRRGTDYCQECIRLATQLQEEAKAKKRRAKLRAQLKRYHPDRSKPSPAQRRAEAAALEKADQEDRARHRGTSLHTLSGGLPTLGRRRK